jgi:hypothetical protein
VALFRRKKQDSVLPDEVNQYYKSQKREKTGVAFALGILALIATLLVGLGVFFGGRYIYQNYIKDDPAPNPTVQVDPNANNPQSEADKKDKPNSGAVGDQQVTPGPELTTPRGQTPSLGDEPTGTLPATGDEGH